MTAFSGKMQVEEINKPAFSRKMREGRRGFLRTALPPLLFGVAFIALWEVIVKAGRVAAYILPAPSAIWDQLWLNRDVVWQVSKASGANAFVGLIAGAAIAVLAAMVCTRFGLLGEVSIPLAAALNALPIIALAPILNNMFDSTSSVPRRLVVGIVVFFPVFINTLRGLREVNPTHRELMDSYAAGGWTFTRKVRLPGALPYLFTGLRQASSLAVIAAVVSEYFADHVGGGEHRVPPGVGLRGRRLPARPALLPGHAAAGAAGRPGRRAGAPREHLARNLEDK